MIINANVLNDKIIKNINTNASGYNEIIKYISNTNDKSIVRIDNNNNITLKEYDGQLIYSSGNTSYYKIGSNIAFKGGDNISLVNITNNVSDIDGAFKNVLYDTTNLMLIKIDPYEYSQST